ncbi:hypothetical protein IW492_06945 [Enterococcus sp. BWB1-3]|uniref:SdrD B-like domain-containing protein n=1 Tax=Enterococcus sp. BWB1-3 TaxID=2787713 RepID=UPI0019249601|nr:SdrD B-like domain-containing protein [Enterococcus sp. BWB1-3]MBL1228968.1 hypothetical protein [Enterococcus sp. BWB1-3]
MKKVLYGIALLLMSIAAAGVNGETAEASLSKINSITGSVYHDINGNGIQDLDKLEVGLAKQKVVLYKGLEDAQNNQNRVKEAASNSLGVFNFSGLEKGTYYLRYDYDAGYKPTISAETAVNSKGEAISGIVKVEATKTLQAVYTTKLSLKRAASLNILPFNDNNWDGVMGEGEEIINGKTMIILNLRRFAEVMETGELGAVNVASLLSNALNGDVDIADAIYLRTTKKGQLINIPNIESDFYIIMRSPFNLTLSGMLENSSKITAILDIIQGKDVTSILNNPELLSTGDIDTNNENRYIKQLAELFPKIADEVDKLNYEAWLGEETAATIQSSTQALRGIGNLIDQIPATRFVKVDYFGNVYDFTGLKIKKTDHFYFGIKQYANITGQVFNDTNMDGKKGVLEFLKEVELTAYDGNGNVLAQTKSPSLVGSYKLEKIPYGQPVYLGVSETAPIYPEVVGGKPEALSGKRIVGVYEFGQTDSVTTITQNIGIGNLTTPTIQVKSKDENLNTAILTFSNKNSSAVKVSYSLNDDSAGTFDIKAKGLLSKESTYDLPLSNVFTEGENHLTVNWTVGIYSGSTILFDF